MEGSSFDENPSVDQDEFAAEWESLQDDLRDDPAETLPDLLDIVERMLQEQGIAVDEPVASEGLERELTADLEVVRDVVARIKLERDVDPGELGNAIEVVRELFAGLQPEITRDDAQPLEDEEQHELEAEAGSVGETNPDQER